MRVKTKEILVIFIMMMFLVSAVGCAGFRETTYKVLYSSGVAYDTTMTVCGDLYKQGKLTDAQKDDIIKYGNGFYVAYHGAVDAFEVWNKTETSVDKDKVVVAVEGILPKLTSLKDYLNRLNVTALNPVLDKLNVLYNLITSF